MSDQRANRTLHTQRDLHRRAAGSVLGAVGSAADHSADLRAHPRSNHQGKRPSCLVCKARRVKCDGARPSCAQCRQVKRACPGYPSPGEPATSVSQTIASSSSPPPEVKPTQAEGKIALPPSTTIVQRTPPRTPEADFSSPVHSTVNLTVFPQPISPESSLVYMYRTRFIPQIAAYEDSAVQPWKHLLFRALESDQTLRYSAASLATYHDHFESRSNSSLVLAEKYYGKTLARLTTEYGHVKPKSSALIRLILNAWLMTTVEFFRGSYLSMCMHMKSIIKVLGEKPTAELTPDLDLAERFFRRAWNYLNLFPALYSFFDSLEPDEIRHRFWLPGQQLTAFSTIDEVDREFHVLYWSLSFYNQSILNGPVIEHDSFSLRQREQLLEAYNIFSDGLETFLVNSATNLSASMSRLGDVFRVWVWAIQIKLSTSISPTLPPSPTPSVSSSNSPPPFSGLESQTSFDSYHDVFQRIVTVIASIEDRTQLRSSLNLDATIAHLPVTFFVIANCRDPRIRRDAIALAKRDGATHAQWYPPAIVRVGMRLIEIEEKDQGSPPDLEPGGTQTSISNQKGGGRKARGVKEIRFASDIPERNRVDGIKMHIDAAAGKGKIGYRCWDHGVYVDKIEDFSWNR